MDDEAKSRLIDAALGHAAFDGWSEASFRAACEDCNLSEAEARTYFPRGGVSLAIAFHQRGDSEMVHALKREDLLSMRYRDRVARAVQLRLNAVEAHKEAVRRGTVLFSLPQYALDGAKLVWGTSDAIWDALGDTSEDANWYSKRGILTGVYGATVLYWLGDTSDDHQKTWDFLDRRIENVMQFEKLKSHVRQNPVGGQMMAGSDWLMSRIRKPMKMPNGDFPSFFHRDRT